MLKSWNSIITYCIFELFLAKAAQLQSGNLVKTFPSWGPNFKIIFDLKVTKTPNGDHNLLHFTTGKDNDGPGTRVPGVWLRPNKSNSFTQALFNLISGNTTTMLVDINMSVKKEFVYSLVLNKSYNIELVQEYGWFYIHVDGKRVWSHSTYTGTAIFKDVQWWQSSNFSPSAGNVAELKNIQVLSTIEGSI